MQLFIITFLLLQVFEKLKYIRVYGCKYLRETPDFSRVTNLNLFNCEGCAELNKIHPSLGYLDKLTKLSFEDCINLEHIPGIDHLVSLEILNLSGCSKLEKFPDRYLTAHAMLVNALFRWNCNRTPSLYLLCHSAYSIEFEKLHKPQAFSRH